MPKKRKKRDCTQQVATVRERYGDDYYKEVGRMSATFTDRTIARKAILKRWNKEKFGIDGQILPEFANWLKEKLDAT